MNHVHLVIPDLFLPQEAAAIASEGLRLDMLEKLLGRAHCNTREASSLEDHLFELLGVGSGKPAPVAPVSAVFDGLGTGRWMRADPLNLTLQREQVLASEVRLTTAESVEICTSLNEYFAGQNLEFFAPHPQRWYIRLTELPEIVTQPVSAVIGKSIGFELSTGRDAVRWNQLFNEIQMLLFAHAINERRESAGEPAVNGLWFWGGGEAVPQFAHNYDLISSDDDLPEMIAASAAVEFAALPDSWIPDQRYGRQLMVNTRLRGAVRRGDLHAWRSALTEIEVSCVQPLLSALRKGAVGQLRLDVPGPEGARTFELGRRDAWAFWRSGKRLAELSTM
jgi:hypothetical protein